MSLACVPMSHAETTGETLYQRRKYQGNVVSRPPLKMAAGASCGIDRNKVIHTF